MQEQQYLRANAWWDKLQLNQLFEATLKKLKMEYQSFNDRNTGKQSVGKEVPLQSDRTVIFLVYNAQNSN